jgi:hypothetical protein
VPAFEALKGRAEALYVCADPLLDTINRIRINTLAHGARLPTIYAIREFVEAGGRDAGEGSAQAAHVAAQDLHCTR